MVETRYEVRYVGPFSEGVEENHEIVKPGEVIEVSGERAAHLIEGDAWELVDKTKRPKAATPGVTVSLEVPPGDVHAAELAADEAEAPAAKTLKDEG